MRKIKSEWEIHEQYLRICSTHRELRKRDLKNATAGTPEIKDANRRREKQYNRIYAMYRWLCKEAFTREHPDHMAAAKHREIRNYKYFSIYDTENPNDLPIAGNCPIHNIYSSAANFMREGGDCYHFTYHHEKISMRPVLS